LPCPPGTCYHAVGMSSPPWMDQTIVQWAQRLLDSYRHWMGTVLLERT
jgi:hypothetical protein